MLLYQNALITPKFFNVLKRTHGYSRLEGLVSPIYGAEP